MTGTLLWFALGALTALLLFVAALPAFMRRAATRERRKLIASLPMSAAEISADRDRIRSAAAEQVRALERDRDATQERYFALRVETDRLRGVTTGYEAARTADAEALRARQDEIAELQLRLAAADAALVADRGAAETALAAVAATADAKLAAEIAVREAAVRRGDQLAVEVQRLTPLHAQAVRERDERGKLAGELGERLIELKRGLAVAEERGRDFEKGRDAAQERYISVRAEAERLRGALAEALAERDERGASVREMQGRVAELQDTMASREAALALASGSLRAAHDTAAQREAEAKRLAVRLREADAAAADRRAEAVAMRAELQALAREILAWQEGEATRVTELAAFRRRAEDAETGRTAVAGELAALRQRLDALRAATEVDAAAATVPGQRALESADALPPADGAGARRAIALAADEASRLRFALAGARTSNDRLTFRNAGLEGENAMLRRRLALVDAAGAAAPGPAATAAERAAASPHGAELITPASATGTADAPPRRQPARGPGRASVPATMARPSAAETAGAPAAMPPLLVGTASATAVAAVANPSSASPELAVLQVRPAAEAPGVANQAVAAATLPAAAPAAAAALPAPAPAGAVRTPQSTPTLAPRERTDRLAMRLKAITAAE